MTKEELEFTVENGVLKGKKREPSTKNPHLGKIILENLKRKPDFVGQVSALTGEEYTFGQIREKTIRCALWLKKQGVSPGDIVVTCSDNNMDCALPMIASLCIGATFNGWDHKLDAKSLKYFDSLVKPKVIFVNESAAPVVSSELAKENPSLRVVVFGKVPGMLSFSEVILNQSVEEIRAFECSEVFNPAIVFLSSGTTGWPKAIELSHACLLGHLDTFLTFESYRDVLGTFSTLNWISGVLITLAALYSGCKRFVFPSFEEELSCKLLQDTKIKWVMIPTNTLTRLTKFKDFRKYDLSSLEVVSTGGSGMSSTVQKACRNLLPDCAVLQMYGMTEFGGVICAQKDNNTKLGSCGTVVSNVEIKIVDPETGKILGPNQKGEIHAKAYEIMMGYKGNPQATKEVIDSEGFLRTGDIGYYDENGEIFIIDRIKELIKYRGDHVSPAEIEAVLQSHPGVKEAAVVGVPVPGDDEHPLAFVTRVSDSKVTGKELIDLVADQLADVKRLRGGVRFLESMQYTSSGKIDRKKLKAMARDLASKA
ncbi:4-coumarate--CoA ligase 1 [Orussus abietinus]|uniref:4-coumarate--CoA ligase 1 n=1 Tax=Orussus abietinus TaxID=222816 RepID=UPI00062666ED|nr:4-coumarate--CoA ligase 1 [Orussus abietinus]